MAFVVLKDSDREKLENEYVQILLQGMDLEDLLYHGFRGVRNLSDLELVESLEDLLDGMPFDDEDEVHCIIRDIQAARELEDQIKNAK